MGCLQTSHTAYLIECSQWHDEESDQEVGKGKTENEIVGHRLEVSVGEDGGHDEHVPWQVEYSQISRGSPWPLTYDGGQNH